MQTILIILLVLLIVYAILRSQTVIQNILSHWHHHFDTAPFSSQEFYQGLATSISTKCMTHVTVSMTNYSQGGLLSPRRDYLQIRYKDYVFNICAAPFAKEYFVSWWLCELKDVSGDFFRRIPIIGLLFTKRRKTFFEIDTEIMFKETISSCIKETIEQLTEAKGLRKIADTEWKEYQHMN